MRKTTFISDLHLSSDTPAITKRFLAFLNSLDTHTDALYILGDLFEFWIGDDDYSAFNNSIAEAIAALSKKNITVFYMHGNRDFLLSSRYAKRANMTILKDPTCVDLYGKPVYLTHGDLLCTDDDAYQRYRQVVHNPIVQALFLILPLSLRRWIASKLRQRSQSSHAQKPSTHMDVNTTAVEAALDSAGVDCMIHGHTHRPAIHDHGANDKDCKRYVLSDWDHEVQVLHCHDDHQVALKQI